MGEQPRHRELQETEASPAVREISRSLAHVLNVSVQLPSAERQAGVVVMHTDPSKERAVVVAKTERAARRFVTFEAKDLQGRELEIGAIKPSPVDVAAYFRAANARQAWVLAEMLPLVFNTIESTRQEIGEAHLREQVKALEIIYPRIEPTFDPRLARVSEALRLQNDFMQRETVLTSADVAKHAGFSRRNPSDTASRWRKAGKIFSVSYRGKDYFPSFQFADDGQPLPSVAPLLATLRTDDTMTDWDVALWFATPNGWLSGQVPKSLLLDRTQETAARLQRAVEQEVTADVE